ncbi:DUF1398 domain-containing protein [Lacipirellula parvula]|uniref:DUF1398 domain-containing protein n=1 Tax=Lacipirellula parvula TaxID=2650471 RepID=UPI001260870D|nr:DUF1398 domain-containing protein [Lacipirellula parvula]
MDSCIIQQTSHATHNGTKGFPEIVGMLTSAGVEYYFVDYAAMATTFYGEGCVVNSPIPYEDMPTIADDLQVDEVRAAILDSQRHGQSHRDFSRRVMVAGVQGYFAFLRGQRITYLGRQGDQHTEWFPGAGPSK